MHNFLRYYRQNRKKIWTAILFAALIIIGLQLLNRYTINQNKSQIGIGNSGNSIQNAVSAKITTPIISQGSIPAKEANNNKDLIDAFVNNCNSQKIEEAYNMLTDECKQMNYPTLESFTNNYYKVIFTSTKMCDIQSWIANGSSYTYQLTFIDDIMSTGKADSTNEINDYITIVKTDGGEAKLNINGYVGRKNINKSYTGSGLNIKIESKDVFMDYEIYNLEIKNTSDKTILLSDKKSDNMVYLEDANSNKYGARMYQVDDILLKFDSGFSRKLNLTFDIVYGTGRVMKSMNFSNIIMNTEEFTDTKNIGINL
ncbi:MAG: hypothetical protein FWC53_00080 [Firmicutes bacterium]|nr:hypothetical protein [Bacillota bacterium]